MKHTVKTICLLLSLLMTVNCMNKSEKKNCEDGDQFTDGRLEIRDEACMMWKFSLDDTSENFKNTMLAYCFWAIKNLEKCGDKKGRIISPAVN